MSSSTTAYIHSYTDLCDYVGNYLSGYAQHGMSVDERREVARRLRDEDGHPAFGDDWSTWLGEHAERVRTSPMPGGRVCS